MVLRFLTMGVDGCEAWDSYNPTFHLILHAPCLRNALNHPRLREKLFLLQEMHSLEVNGFSREGCFAVNGKKCFKL